MPRCPLCGSALVTVVESLYPRAVCSGCGARWIQDGHQQRAITKVQEPSLLAQRPSLRAEGSLPAGSRPSSTRTRAHHPDRPAAPLEASPW